MYSERIYNEREVKRSGNVWCQLQKGGDGVRVKDMVVVKCRWR